VAKDRQREHDDPPVDPFDALVEEDDALVLLFMCCHPSLTPPSAIALTLRAVGGLTTAEIAHAFMVPLATMAQRISRAKETVRESGVPFEKPGPEEWSARLASVLHVLYLVFNEGYTSSVGPDLHRPELAEEAIRLARLVHARRPNEGEVAGLLALMLLTDARRAARTSASGDPIPLDEQDRSLWDAKAIAEGVALVTDAMSKAAVGPYQLQAAIAAIHDEAKSTADTDWGQIFALYGLLERMSDNPMVSLNRAVALAMVHGPAAGLARLAELEGDARLEESHRLEAVRAHLHEMAGDHTAAIASFRAAAARTTNVLEQKYLLAKANKLLA
jgi:predicted RNA polymerase sigma factor